jgi:hypothetical protein
MFAGKYLQIRRFSAESDRNPAKSMYNRRLCAAALGLHNNGAVSNSIQPPPFTCFPSMCGTPRPADRSSQTRLPLMPHRRSSPAPIRHLTCFPFMCNTLHPLAPALQPYSVPLPSPALPEYRNSRIPLAVCRRRSTISLHSLFRFRYLPTFSLPFGPLPPRSRQHRPLATLPIKQHNYPL